MSLYVDIHPQFGRSRLRQSAIGETHGKQRRTRRLSQSEANERRCRCMNG